MIEITRILCPIDLSDPSRRALDHAVAIARWYGAAITVLRVIPSIMPIVSDTGVLPYPFVPITAADRAQLRADTEAFVSREAGGPPMDTLVVDGDPSREILDHADRLGAGLIVMGTHGLRGFDRLLLGSVTERVLRRAPCPVLTVPLGAPDAVPSTPGLYKRILCGVDFSPASIAALRVAASIAKEADARLIVAHAVEHIALWPLPAGAPDVESLEHKAREAARGVLRGAITDDVRVYAHVEEIVASGKAYRALLQIAEARGVDLIVAGAHGGLAGLLHFGSTTNHLVRAASCPVLTVRA